MSRSQKKGLGRCSVCANYLRVIDKREGTCLECGTALPDLTDS